MDSPMNNDQLQSSYDSLQPENVDQMNTRFPINYSSS